MESNSQRPDPRRCGWTEAEKGPLPVFWTIISMTTEALPFPTPAAEESHRGPLLEGRKSSEAFPVGNGDPAKNVALTTSPDDSWPPPLDGALISFDEEDTVVGHPSASVQKGGPFNESSLSPLTSSEAFKVADDQGPNGGHFVLQGKLLDPFVEPLKAADTSSLSSRGEDGSHSACQGERPETSEVPNPVENSEQMPEGGEERPHNRQDPHPAATADSLKRLEPSDASSELGQGEKGSPRGLDGDTSEVRSKRQPSDSSISSHLDIGEESRETEDHSRTPGVASESPAQPEAAGGPKETACSAENSQDCLLPQTPNQLLQGSDSPSQAREGSCPLFPGHDPSGASSAEPRGTFDAADDVDEGLKPGGRETTETGEGERVTGGQEPQPVALGKDPVDLKGQLLDETPVGNSQGREAPVAQDRDPKADGTSQALASTDPQPSVGTSCQQRAAGTSCDDTFPEAVPPLSLVATNDCLEPAHKGLTPGRDEEEREGPGAPESHATGGCEDKPLGEAGGQAVVESEKGEEAAGDAEPDSTRRREPAGAEVLAREVPGLESGVHASPGDPLDAMVLLACAPESLDPRRKEVSQDSSGIQALVTTSEQAGSRAKPRRGLLFDSKEPTDTEDREGATDPDLDELSGAGGPSTDWMEDDTGSRCPTAETPIEREIRLHLEREELLRQQRGLTSSRGTQEYVEVRIRPFLSQSLLPSPLAKEKELQWAGVQMQREIRRECQREEDLVQLGKVRGTYDRGTPQELQEKKMIFEQAAPLEPLAPTKNVSGGSEKNRERSFVETDGATSPVAPASGTLPQPQPERPSTANPFFSLRAKSPQSLLEREVQEAQERERELQRQRKKIYGSALPQQPEEASGQGEEGPCQPERPPCKKLDVTWPPPSPSEPCQVNGLHQLEKSPRSRQKSALIQRWESGTVGTQESQD